MVRKIGVVIAAATLFTSLGLSAAAAETKADLAKDRDNRTRQECIQNGGWYHTDNGVCEYESSAKAALIEADRKECERQGGWFHTDNGVCEMESKSETK